MLFTLLLGICLLIYSQIIDKGANNKTEITAKLKSVIDGDTLHFTMDNEVIKCRVLGIDTPEKFDSKKLDIFTKKYNLNKSQVKNAGKSATKFAEKFFNIGQEYKVKLTGKDVYNRDLCIIKKDDLIYNEEVIGNGTGAGHGAGICCCI